MVAAVTRSSRRPWHPWALAALIVVAVALRFQGLSAQSFWLDELHSLEGACAHGVDHQTIPTGHLINRPPELTRLASAGPAWSIWTSMARISHPPGYYALLRLWIELFGESESAVRSLSAFASVAALVVLFLAVRSWAGPEPALWVAALMAVAGPQVHASHDARPYAAMQLLGTLVLWTIGRVVRLGPSWPRAVALAALLITLLFTHYFSLAVVAAVGVYGLCFTRGSRRRHLVAAPFVAGVMFAATWGPLMWRQRATFSPSDRSASFLSEPGSDHVAKTLGRLLSVPVSCLVDRRPIPVEYGLIGAAMWGTAIALCFRRRWPAIWPLWLLAPAGLVASLDLTRSTGHLKFIRYVLLAAPAAYTAIALLPTVHRHLGRLSAAAAVAFAAWSLSAADLPPNEDFRSLGEAVAAAVSPGQPIVFAGPADRYGPQILYLAVSHYAGPPSGPVALLESPASPSLLNQLPATVWMVADPEVRLAREWLPGYHLAAGNSWPVVGSLLRMERNSASSQGSSSPR